MGLWERGKGGEGQTESRQRQTQPLRGRKTHKSDAKNHGPEVKQHNSNRAAKREHNTEYLWNLESAGSLVHCLAGGTGAAVFVFFVSFFCLS